MKLPCPTIRAATGIVATLTAAALVLLLLPDNRKPAPPEETETETDLLATIQQFARYMSADSGYTVPSLTERRSVGDGVRRTLDGKPGEATDVLAAAGYAISKQVDTGTRRAFYEIYDAMPQQRGWGRVLIDTSTVHLGIEIPHPKADIDSESLGVALFRAVPGSVLVIAGAHRRAAPEGRADMAHTTDSVFEAVHEALVAQRIPVMQLHGFDNETAPDSDVVVSAGPKLRSDYVERVAKQLESAGLSVCRPWEGRCSGLAATTNVQAQWSDTHDDDFAHVEVSRDNRDSADGRDRVVAALAKEATER